MHTSIPFEALLAFGDSFSSQCALQHSCQQADLSRLSAIDRFEACRKRSTESWLPIDSVESRRIHRNCTANGGWNYLNYLTRCTKDGVDPLTCPTRLLDLAVSGAEVTQYQHDYPRSLEWQVAQWSRDVRPTLDIKPDKTIVSIAIGMNDIHQIASTCTIGEFTDFLQAEKMIRERMTVVMTLLAGLEYQGFERFILLNVPPLNAEDSINTVRLLWNAVLAQEMIRFRQDTPWTRLDLIDVDALYGSISPTYTDDMHWSEESHAQLATHIKSQMGWSSTRHNNHTFGWISLIIFVLIYTVRRKSHKL